jgi:hypothetical protein
MRFDLLCDLELTPPDQSGSSGRLDIAIGEGAVTGGRLAGTLRYSLRTRPRPDGFRALELHGLITTADRAAITVTALGNADASGWGALSVSFEAQSEAYRWLNGAVCVGEVTASAAGTLIRVSTAARD